MLETPGVKTPHRERRKDTIAAEAAPSSIASLNASSTVCTQLQENVVPLEQLTRFYAGFLSAMPNLG
jgi:hypothetical protein